MAVPIMISLPWFVFYSGDRGEPRHIHVAREHFVAKFWLEPVRLADSSGFGRMELRRFEMKVAENAANFVRCWDEFFGS